MLTTESMVVRLVYLAVLCWMLHVRNIQSLESSMSQLCHVMFFLPCLIWTSFPNTRSMWVTKFRNMQDLVDTLHSLASAHLQDAVAMLVHHLANGIVVDWESIHALRLIALAMQISWGSPHCCIRETLWLILCKAISLPLLPTWRM